MAALIIKISGEKEEKRSIIGRGEDDLSPSFLSRATAFKIQPIDEKAKRCLCSDLRYTVSRSTTRKSKAPQSRYLAMKKM